MESEGPIHTIDRTPEYEEFMARLKAYHAQRGTTLDPEPKVSNVNLDLYKTFNLIVANGGYDKVTEEKLLWRKMREKLGIPTTNEPSTAYQLKEKYYKNLAAFEISTVHGKEPPPKDILEDVTAKGGSLLTRTRENFRGGKHESSMAGDSAASGDDATATPSRDRTAPETTPTSASLRASRGLREAPPQRVIFQPDTAPARSSRHSSATQAASHLINSSQDRPSATPQNVNGQPSNSPVHYPAHNQTPGQLAHTPVPFSAHGRVQRGPSDSFTPQDREYVSSAVDSYQPASFQPMHGIPLRPVDTPSNNPIAFARRRHAAPQPQPLKGPRFPPGVNMPPSIYIRCVNGLLSGIPSEQAFALNHLVRISFERGDKFRFEQFGDLARGLVEKVLEVSSLFYEVKWNVDSLPPWCNAPGPNTLSIDGTPDILERIDSLKPKHRIDSVHPADFADQLQLINEAALTLRNMVLLADNAYFLSIKALVVKDAICIALKLPPQDSVIELKHLMVEVAEAITPYLELESSDPLYKVLMDCVDSDDLGMVLGCLRALTRISIYSEETNKLENVPASVLRRVCTWLLVDDNELKDACLDFLYQYTAVVSNVDSLLSSIECQHLVTHLVRLLSHGAKQVQRQIIMTPELKVAPPELPCPMPPDLLQDLLKLNEPERCQAWVRCFFEEDKDSFVTQITAWQAYQNAFTAALKTIGQFLITPADFIRNSTTVYKESKAEVLTTDGPGEQPQQKFIIQGIRARRLPIGLDGKEYRRCLWDSERPGEKCGLFFHNTDDMATHVTMAHLGITKNSDGLFPNVTKPFACLWADCTTFSSPVAQEFGVFARHLATHAACLFPHNVGKALSGSSRPNWVQPAKLLTLTYLETPTAPDERNPSAPPRPGGIPLSAALILRNIARNVPKTQAEEALLNQGQSGGWNERLFLAVRPHLFYLLAHNQPLVRFLPNLYVVLQGILTALPL
ncbi:hypothetical protein SODALDRAFT_281889 [Sodiomyces alkalinus F11]|uniref:Chromatin structure-remodeling complex subunit rsc9 n=1 Tax=Sodiomyces alkalinus (strain CBS 110278 / VKM F-3762 / F11) TaxID=1314773 RepID=A0A3N2PP95_SODAK|nr:hypothetical protein SODALDRAFT_281889 [Sodiomyces alkalinus F11]ROT36254.1 hypothetical protein SODALDRAFT_281889 [Sodiomyces alkalinus F11]